MTRNFASDPVSVEAVAEVVDLARRSPSAGNTQAVDFLVLTDGEVAAYWDVTLPVERRAAFAWPGLLNAPVLILIWVSPGSYVSRYGEDDKSRAGLGDDLQSWTTPYWWVDGGMAAMSALLAAQASGLGALFFGVFDHEDEVRQRFGVPEDRRVVGAIAMGHPAEDQRVGSSARRPRRTLDDVMHLGEW
jgi:nitroreductase